MIPFSDIERDFAWAVLDGEASVPGPLVGKSGRAASGKTVTRSFAVYQNNVYASLIDALASRFPVTARLVGEEFFQAMARIYIGCEPPRSAVLLRYGTSFADFVVQFSPAGSVPYLADVARLEWAWHAAYHSADATQLTLAELTEAGPDAEDITISLHPSLGVVRAPFPVVTIWQISGREEKDEPTQLPDGGEDALVVRPKLDVEVRRLPEGGAVFVLALKGGATLQEAASSAMQEAPAFDLKANLAGLITSGAIVSVR